MPDYFMAMDPGTVIEKIDGKLIRKGLPLHWINEAGLDKIWVDAIGRPGQSGSPIINEYAEICATFCGEGHGKMKGTLIVE